MGVMLSSSNSDEYFIILSVIYESMKQASWEYD